jgi:hypothetical protein
MFSVLHIADEHSTLLLSATQHKNTLRGSLQNELFTPTHLLDLGAVQTVVKYQSPN